MKYGRVITAAVCAVALLAALCGCGDTPQEVSDPTTTASTTTTTTAEETTTTTAETTADTTTATTPKSTTKKPTTTTTTKKPTTTTTNSVPKSLPLQYASVVENSANGKSLDIVTDNKMDEYDPDDWESKLTKEKLLIIVISNVEELENFVQRCDGSNNHYSDLMTKYQRYDTTYFSNKSLLVVAFPGQSGSLENSISSIVRTGNEMCIEWNMWNRDGNIETDDVHSYFLIVEIKTEDLEGVEKWSHHKTYSYNSNYSDYTHNSN